MSDPIHVLHVVSEVAPFSKTGGLADVAGALPQALARLGLRVSVVTPRYGSIDPARFSLARRLEPLEVPLGRRREPVTIFEGRLPGGVVPCYFLDHPFFHREGYYGDASGDYPDNGLRFALLSRGALELAHRLNDWPDVVHGHDWQAGLAIHYARRAATLFCRPVPATVMTIHNLAFQGNMPKTLVSELELGWDIFTPEVGEFYDQLSLLKLGLAQADRITTVSPRYAREIQTPEFGHGLDGFLRAHAAKLVGILNGIDLLSWNPDRDPYLPVRYDAADRTGKAACKAALQRELGLAVRAGTPLIVSISRLYEQKGFDLVLEASSQLSQLDAQFAFLGTGERRFEEALAHWARRQPAKIAVRLAYDERLAHFFQAAGDLFLMPSRYEPCGLTQLIALRYGTIPIVRAVGGLDDTVVDFDERTRTGTGFKFIEYTPAALVHTVKRALTVFAHKDVWAELVARAMRQNYGWDTSARRYAELYAQVRPRAAASSASADEIQHPYP